MSSVIPVTLVTPCYKTPKYFLERLIIGLTEVKDSIEWILVDDSPNSIEVTNFARRASEVLPNFKLVSHEANQGIRSSYLSGFRQASGHFIGILDHDDEINLKEIIEIIRYSAYDYDVIYTNEAKFNHNIIDYYIKPDFDYISAFYYYYPHHITFFEKERTNRIIDSSKLLDTSSTAFDIAFWYEYLSSFDDRDIRVLHLPFTSYGWRIHEESTASSVDQKPTNLIERRAFAEHFLKKYEDGDFDVFNRTDIPFAVSGLFGKNYSSLGDYVKQYFDITVCYIRDERETQRLCEDFVTIAEPVLSTLPLGYLSKVMAGVDLYIARNSHVVCGSGHIPHTPFLRPVEHLADGQYLKLRSREASARGRQDQQRFEICIAGEQ